VQGRETGGSARILATGGTAVKPEFHRAVMVSSIPDLAVDACLCGRSCPL